MRHLLKLTMFPSSVGIGPFKPFPDTSKATVIDKQEADERLFANERFHAEFFSRTKLWTVSEIGGKVACEFIVVEPQDFCVRKAMSQSMLDSFRMKAKTESTD